MRDVHWQQALKSVYRVSYHSLPIRGPVATSFMDDNHDTHEIEEEANASTSAPPRRRCLTPGRQALADSMMKSVAASVSKLTSGYRRPTIYIVPQRIRQVNEVAYEPQTVSIGPYHHGKERLKGMEEHKWQYLHSFLSRNPNRQLEDYLEAIEELEDEARSCYSNNVGPQMGNEFVKMMVLDGCFIVEFLLRLSQRKKINRAVELKKQKEESEQKQEELKMVHDGCFCVELFTKLKQNEEELKPKEEELQHKEKELQQKEELKQKEKEQLDPEEELKQKVWRFLFRLELFKDPILDTTGMVSLIGFDMLLLENQIPFLVLHCIFRMACPVNQPHLLVETALDFFDTLMPMRKKIQTEHSCHHLLHLFHSHLVPHSEEPNHYNNSIVKSVPNKEPNLLCNPTIESVLNKLKNLFLPSSCKSLLPLCNNPSRPSPPLVMNKMIPCAAELQLAGVKLKKNENCSSILDVKFSRGVLEIPRLSIYDYTNARFRNLIAFEQCYPQATKYFTTYSWFMDCLVNTSKDVALLHRNEIIDHGLGSDEEVAQLFNRLCIGIFHDVMGSYLWDLDQKVQKHCKNKWNRWRASLKRDYFTNPWSVLSLIAASILLLVTITQTFFTVFPYYRPRS